MVAPSVHGIYCGIRITNRARVCLSHQVPSYDRRCASTDSLTFDIQVHQPFLGHVRLSIKERKTRNTKYHIVFAALLCCQISS